MKNSIEQKKAHFRNLPTDSLLAQLGEHGTDDLEVVSSNLTGAIFDEIYFVLCNLDLSDNLTEMRHTGLT